jgi:hypothetical protein
MGTSLYGAIPLNVDVNQLGASANPRLSITQPSPYYSALVEDVILNEDHPNYDKETGMQEFVFFQAIETYQWIN